MADEPGKRDNDKQAPDEGSAKGSGESEGKSELPEVEAELVTEKSASESSDDAFDADAPKEAGEPGPAPGEAEPGSDDGAEKSARKSAFTPGVMLFLAFVVVALIAFAVWRFSPLGAPSPEAEPVQTSAAPDEAPAEDESPAPGTEDLAVPDEDAASGKTPPEDEPADAKIANAPAGELKTSPAAIEEGDSGFLPPVAEEGAKKIENTVEPGAKDAMRALDDEEASADTAGAPLTEEGVEPEESVSDSAPAEDTQRAEVETEDAGESIAEEAASEEDEAQDDVAPAELSEADPSNEPADSAAVEQLETQLAQLRADFSDEKQNFENDLADQRRINADLMAEVESLRAQLTDVETARAQAVNEEVVALRAEVEKLRREQANVSARQMRASFALAALSRAIDQGDPFTQELAAVEEFAPDAAAVLEPYAADGVATEAALRIGFDAAAREALAAAGQEKAGGGLKGLIARAQGLVSVRPAEPVAGDAPGAVLSRAENALEEGDVAFALSQLGSLPPAAKEAMAEWTSDAKARAAAEAALAALQTEITGETG
ncbi:mitofilin family membrane protein [Hyphococcus luteus]|uniref:Mitochondrial inner membrane protein n=1 Tax=Hyphococcus luteus TaxID=2058213 RepID=A0A2S7K6C3_9PROT|nr:mitofilin family membrane protein [Marinicaulis flavus]PQA88053.1 hypothetical protein CW354_06910 [Marinicaulis flavus]